MNPSSSARVLSSPTLADALSRVDCGDEIRAAVKAGDVAVIDMAKPEVSSAIDARRARQAPSPKSPRGSPSMK